MVKLTPTQQQRFVRAEPDVFAPVTGAWGRRGSTNVCLRTAKSASVRRALVAAWHNAAARRLTP